MEDAHLLLGDRRSPGVGCDGPHGLRCRLGRERDRHLISTRGEGEGGHGRVHVERRDERTGLGVVEAQHGRAGLRGDHTLGGADELLGPGRGGDQRARAVGRHRGREDRAVGRELHGQRHRRPVGAVHLDAVGGRREGGDPTVGDREPGDRRGGERPGLGRPDEVRHGRALGFGGCRITGDRDRAAVGGEHRRIRSGGVELQTLDHLTGGGVAHDHAVGPDGDEVAGGGLRAPDEEVAFHGEATDQAAVEGERLLERTAGLGEVAQGERLRREQPPGGRLLGCDGSHLGGRGACGGLLCEVLRAVPLGQRPDRRRQSGHQRGGHAREQDSETAVVAPVPFEARRGLRLLAVSKGDRRVEELPVEARQLVLVIASPLDRGVEAAGAVELAVVAPSGLPLLGGTGEPTVQDHRLAVLVQPPAEPGPRTDERLVSDLDPVAVRRQQPGGDQLLDDRRRVRTRCGDLGVGDPPAGVVGGLTRLDEQEQHAPGGALLLAGQ